uniref:Calmodulin binding transcription activator 2 n=1 Tax=Sarcophilus harrisii TaxID=9305 RepID=A0A7N4PS65_SARHA
MNNKDTTEVAENSHHLKIFLPKKLLECLPRCPLLPPERLRWNTNEEIASYLITFEKHDEWLSCSPKTRPQNGSIILYNRKKVKYRKDGYCWKKRKDGKTTREDHMKLKVQGMEVPQGPYPTNAAIPSTESSLLKLNLGPWPYPQSHLQDPLSPFHRLFHPLLNPLSSPRLILHPLPPLPPLLLVLLNLLRLVSDLQ